MNNDKELAINIANNINGHLGTNAETKKIPVGISNRHIHLSQFDLEILFGEGYQMSKLKDLKQPGQFAANETVCIAGPKGSIVLKEKAIIAKRHIHMAPEDAQIFNVTNGQKVCVAISGERKGILGEVVVRVNPNYSLEFHVDTDEANGMGLSSKDTVEISTLIL
ncbi:PduL/EutD family phosphate acyltransferase [Clostridium aciditolerans]|uniref:Phosphate propanoyltransferase n=1 Tax=Clostridium aciditolerans TaxID=339861 RepID=A0A934HT99_9CLOT|nr:PduL/EutD family phosphate acyltransferase [Clostridium aciditolerans]MBI6874116.1 phosphate propanoyltransferase [Clostridium aciditolerans]